MELRHMRYFLALAEELHFGRAAARLQIAQPPLSRQIRALEGELGVPLVLRTPRGVQLTDAGRVFRDECREALDRAERAGERARSAGRGEVGRLAIGFDPALELALVPRLVSPFAARHRDVRLAVHSLAASEQAAALSAGTIDVGIMPMPTGVSRDLVAEPLVSEELCAVLPQRHRLAGRPRLTLRLLAGAPLVLLRRQPSSRLRDLVVELFQQAGLVPDVRCEASHVQTCLALVAAGVGVTFLPAGARGVCSAGVVHRRLVAPGATLPIGLVHRAHEPSAFVHQFEELAHATFGDPRRATLACGSTDKVARLPIE